MYETAAKFYGSLFDPLMSSLRAIGLSLHPPGPGTQVLDVGCGNGAHLQLYQGRGCQVTGLDRSPAMLSAARRSLSPGAQLHLGDGTRLPYRDRSFDLVLMAMAIHEHDPGVRSALLAEAARVTRRDGRILVIDFHPGPFRFPKGWAQRALIIAIELLGGWEHFTNHLDFLATGGLPAMLARCDLEADATKIVGKGTLGLYLLRPIGA